MLRISLSRDKIILLRKALDMSQKEFAKFLGVKWERVVRWEEDDKKRIALAPQYRKVGRTIRGLRLNLKMSQSEFATRLSVKRETVARWESGTKCPLPICLTALDKLSLQTTKRPLFNEPS